MISRVHEGDAHVRESLHDRTPQLEREAMNADSAPPSTGSAPEIKGVLIEAHMDASLLFVSCSGTSSRSISGMYAGSFGGNAAVDTGPNGSSPKLSS